MADPEIQGNVIRHAQRDMANVPTASHEATDRSLFERAVEKRNEWAAEQPSFLAQMGALWREGLKDMQDVVLHAFPDSQRGVEEPGTPLHPTQQQVTANLGNFHGYDKVLADAASRAPSAERQAEMER